MLTAGAALRKAARASANLGPFISTSLEFLSLCGQSSCNAIRVSTIDSGHTLGIKGNLRCTRHRQQADRPRELNHELNQELDQDLDHREKRKMRSGKVSRRDVLKGTGVVLAGAALSTRVMANAPPPEPVTPALIEAAKKEGQVSYYTSTDLPVAEKLAKAFEAKYPGIAVRVERTGAERVFQRIGQEYSSNIHAVDVVNSSDAAHFIVWKRDGLLAPYVPEDVTKFYPAEHG